MNKIRIYELAKKLDMESKEIVDFLQDLGADVKNHMSSIEADIADLVESQFRKEEPKVVTSQESETASKEKIVKRAKRQRSEDRPEKNNKRNVRPQKRGGGSRGRKPQRSAPVLKLTDIDLPDMVSIKDLASKLGIPATKIIKQLMNQGVMATITQSVEFEPMALALKQLGVTARPIKDIVETIMEDKGDEPDNLKSRPPVVTIMGHVDHGKTTLLDAIRKTKVTQSEAGGITQHIGAYQVLCNDRPITFLDTPGHEAFAAMRSRGAKVTDIAILVVAADDGVMPQTVEAINHAKEADVPIIVAVNKIDKPNANPDRVKQELTEYDLISEDWGGSTVFVELSALRGEGIDDLLEMILLVSEMEELQANPERPARGTVIEARLDKGFGPLATVLITTGTLRVGDAFVAGNAYGRVRAMADEFGKAITEAGPSAAVAITGISQVPDAGDALVVVKDDQAAKQASGILQDRQRKEDLKGSARVSLEDLFANIQEGVVQDLKIVIKADVQGSAEALRAALEKLSTDEVKVTVIHQGVGAVSESDVHLATAAGAIVIAFNVRPQPNALRTAEREGVDMRFYRVIYSVIDDVKLAMEGLLAPDYKEATLGRAEVRATFKVPNSGIIAGCYVIDGKITRNALARVLRDSVVIHEGKISSLRRFKDDAREVAQGYECGIGIENYNDLQEGDQIEAYVMEEIARKL